MPASVGRIAPCRPRRIGDGITAPVGRKPLDRNLIDRVHAPRHGGPGRTELRRGEPVADLRNAIGINDKFLLIRDLFGGDGEAYEEAIATLNAFDDFDECMIHIAENYAWNPNSDGAKFMMELLERKFA